MNPILKPAEKFFASRGWKPFEFQEEAWESYLKGDSGLIHVPTGSGKTYAAIMGPFCDFMARPRKGLKAIYLTPLRALARDLEHAINEPINEAGWPIKVESRTGDTKPTARRKQFRTPPDLLLTTPESLAVMISQPDGEDILKKVEVVILDEWHELLASKRGSLTELCLSYLRFLNPELRTWALSASIGNLEEAARVAVGPFQEPKMIAAQRPLAIGVELLMPEKIDAFPWAGHLGFALKDALIKRLDRNISTLIFTNTRSQAERWYAALVDSVPEMKDVIALHHSSLSREERELVEEGVKNGDLKWIVCTSSLDLGVDFQPVEQVVQVGSPKMVARFVQRAGRAAHRPGGMSQILFVPTNSWEILELEAVKKSLGKGDVESRRPLHKPIDVLLQHMTTLACGAGFKMDELRQSLQSTYSFAKITDQELNWCLKFLTLGGEVLSQYPQFQKLIYDEETGRYHLRNSKMASHHRMSIGTIVSRESVALVFSNRKRLGFVEENFISKLKRGDVFQFGGRKLELIMIRDMMAYVRASTRSTNTVPSWDGGLLPMSETLASSLRETLTEPHPEIEKNLSPLLDAQRKNSVLPSAKVLLCETWSSKEGEHLFVFPFAGRLVHEGLSQLWAVRFAQRSHATFSFSVNEYGFEIMGPSDYDFEKLFDDDFFAHDNLEAELGLTIQMGELSQRQFREICSIAGLVFNGFPGARKSGKQMQVSSSLLYEVFKKYDPNNLLLKQSVFEVLHGTLESDRLKRTLERLAHLDVQWKKLNFPSPLSFPLYVGMGMGSRVSNESIEMKVSRLKKKWEKAYDSQTDGPRL